MRIPESLESENPRTRLRFFEESVTGCLIVACLGVLGYLLHLNSTPVGFLFLLIVVAEASLCGFRQATMVSVAAAACLQFFYYPPLLRLNMSDSQGWVALGAFELGALLVSRVSSRERRSSREAATQRRAMEQLYELSRSTLLINLHQAPGPQLVQLIQQIFSVEGVAIFDANSGKSDRTGTWGDCEEDLARECFFMHADGEDAATRTRTRVLRTGPSSVGAIAIRGQLSSLVMDALASLAAITLDRWVSFEKESRIEAAHQSERLRAAVLDSLAHAVKTPLTAIQTANAGPREVGPLNEPQDQLASLVDKEATQLNQLCTRLLQTAKLNTEDLSLHRDEIVVTDLVSRVLREQSGSMGGHLVEVTFPNSSLTVRGDPELLSMALVQLLDNAAKYSFAGEKVKVTAWASHSEVTISVHNFGPPIPIAERDRVFQRFYRSEGSKGMAAGTGLGLSTVKMAAEAHCGHAWVISNAGEGTTFFISLPQDGRRSE